MRAYFLSDLHLGARYFPNPLETERHVVRFLESIRHDATHIFLVGDILDYWYEYRYVVPKGYTRFFGKLAELADAGVKITWLAGNHDIWLHDYFPTELGVRVLDGSLTIRLGEKTFFLNHGDTVGRRPAKFRFIQTLFRNPLCQFLFSAIHPRWTVPLGLGWSQANRLGKSRRKTVRPAKDPEPFSPEENTLVEFARQYKATHPEIDYFVFGHLHLLADVEIAPQCSMVLLGEWLKTCSYALFDGHRLTLHTFPRHDAEKEGGKKQTTDWEH